MLRACRTRSVIGQVLQYAVATGLATSALRVGAVIAVRAFALSDKADLICEAPGSCSRRLRNCIT